MSVVLLRHASAGHRHAWEGHDQLRPLDECGLRQALALRDLIAPRVTGPIVSSPYVRCIETVEPLARALGVGIELDGRLADGADADEALACLAELEGGVACTHGAVIDALLSHGLEKGTGVAVEVEANMLHVHEGLLDGRGEGHGL